MSETDIPAGIDPETGEVTEQLDDEEAVEAEPNPAETGGGSDDPGEGESTDSSEPPPDEPADDPTPTASESDIERNTKGMNRAADAYIKKVVGTLGDDLAGMQTCPLCADSWPGLRFPVMPSPDNLAKVRVAIGLEPGDNLPKDNYSRPCDACDGWGFTDSGSKVAGHTKLTCVDCSGKGWIAVGAERAGGAITAPNGTPGLPMPTLQDNASNDPPEVEALKQLGYIVVAPARTEAL